MAWFLVSIGNLIGTYLMVLEQSSDSLAQAIELGLTDNALRGNILEKGQKIVEARLSAEKMVAQYVDIYLA